jgi:hypothetical protein
LFGLELKGEGFRDGDIMWLKAVFKSSRLVGLDDGITSGAMDSLSDLPVELLENSWTGAGGFTSKTFRCNVRISTPG